MRLRCWRRTLRTPPMTDVKVWACWAFVAAGTTFADHHRRRCYHHPCCGRSRCYSGRSWYRLLPPLGCHTQGSLCPPCCRGSRTSNTLLLRPVMGVSRSDVQTAGLPTACLRQRCREARAMPPVGRTQGTDFPHHRPSLPHYLHRFRDGHCSAVRCSWSSCPRREGTRRSGWAGQRERPPVPPPPEGAVARVS